MRTYITGGPLFDGLKLYESGSVLIENGQVAKIYTQPAIIKDARVVNTQGDLIMPGLVDLHSDSLERSIEKRKGVYFDIDFAILNLDRQLASCGITSFFHAISFADNELGLRSPKEAEKCVRKIKAFTGSNQSLVKHNTHIRYEVGSLESFNVIVQLLEEGLVDLISVMDHTPGQGQFKSLEAYQAFHQGEYDLGQDAILEKAKAKQDNNDNAWAMVGKLAATVKNHGIPMLSHDDDTPAKVDFLHAMGIRASEFPVSMAAVTRAVHHRMSVFMGAPNLVRDASTNGNLKASDAMAQGMLTGLVSDYYPESLFQACFIAARNSDSPEHGLQKATAGPGNFLNPDSGPGMIRPGGDADIIVVNQDHDWAHITRSFVRGRQIFRIDPV